ncbi:MAG: lysophospholipase [Hyphomonas sp.]|nr:lysophospholipase [Hyphomonas sp.]
MADTPATETWDFGRGRAGYVWRSHSPKAKLLLAHGYGEYAERYVEHYHRLIPHLVALGLDVYAFDLQGHGRSDGARGVADMHRAVADHIAARTALTTDEAPVFLFGHSLGGLVTAASVAKSPGGVAGVVLSAPALLVEIGGALKAVAGLVSLVAPGARLTPPIAPESLSRIPEEVEAYTADPMICLKPPSARLGATAIAVSEDGWRRYEDWRAPVLLVHGAKDAATPARGSERFFGMIRSTDKTLEVFPEGYHELLNDLDRDAARTLILGWLEARLPH